jgi:predicted enzyme related to lactoylglutathione lyase
MKIERYEPGVPSWVDIGSPDPQATAAFSGALFGWESEEGPPESGGYRLAEIGGIPVAGIGPAQNPGPPFWATYVNVDDADATAELVTANGGQVLVPPMDVLDVGRMAVFMDPVGAAFSVWQPKLHAGAGLVNEPGTLSWNELITTDLDASAAFYGAVFGWGTETHGEGPGAYTEWQLAGRSVGGMMLKPPMMPAEVPPMWGVYFAVADTDVAVARVVELGGSVMMPPTDIEPGRFSVVADPQGAAFSVIALSEARTG